MACELCGREASSRYLCEPDTTRLAKRLAELPTLYAEVAECLVPRRAGWGDIIATKGAAGPRSPLNEDVLDVVSVARTAEVVHQLRVAVQRERWPRHGAPPPPAAAAASPGAAPGTGTGALLARGAGRAPPPECHTPCCDYPAV